MSGANKACMKRIGYFGESGYTSIGEPYKTSKAKSTLSRYEGAQFQTNPKFVGDQRFKLNNGQFSKAPSLYNGEPYQTLQQFQLKEANKLKSKNISDNPFKPTNPPKVAAGNLGSNFGTVGYSNKLTPDYPLGGLIKYVPQGAGVKKMKGEVVNEPYNIITNPMKKGTYGMVGTTLGVPCAQSEKQKWKGVTGEYTYVPDPYDSAKIAEKEWKKKQPKAVSETPFRPANPAKRGGPGMWGGHKGMSDHPKDCGGAISMFHPYMPTSTEVKKTKADVEANRWKDPYDRSAFKPSNPPKKGGPGYWGVGKKGGGTNGGAGTLNAFPEATADPYDTLRATLLSEKKKKKESLGVLSDRSAFCPASFGRSTCTPSVFCMNIRI